MKILVVPGNVQNAKSYPHWDRLLVLLKHHEVRIIKDVIPLQEIVDLVNWCDVWISIDSFLQHLVQYHRLKPGIVLWGKSDPELFGHSTNINLLKDRKYLRDDQFKWWQDEPVNPDAFVKPEVVLLKINQLPCSQQ